LADYDALILCTAPRSGSTLLCRLLQGTGRAGVPDSYFYSTEPEDWFADQGLKQSDFGDERAAWGALQRAVIRQGRGESGVFALRLQAHSRDGLIGYLRRIGPEGSGDRDRIEAAFGRVLFLSLRREDPLDQAISYVKARQTGLWHMAPDGREIERLSPPQDPRYDARAIAAQLAQCRAWDAAWERWYQREDIAPLRLTYERLAADSLGAVNSVLTALGTAPVMEIEIPTARLAQADNLVWAERFRAGHGVAPQGFTKNPSR